MKDRYWRAKRYVAERQFTQEAIDIACLKFNLDFKQRERLLKECQSLRSQAQ